MATETYDVVTYGNTWAGVNAACAAAQRGAKAALVSPYEHIGGCIANGLGNIDLGTGGTAGIGFMSAEFFSRCAELNGGRSPLRRVSPSQAERVFLEMLRHYGVYVRPGFVLDSVLKSSTAITSITAADGTVFAGSQFIDCTEEGDLAAAAGVTMVVGREAASQYTESLGGFLPQPQTFTPFNCYEDDGVTLLPGFTAYPTGLVSGDADDGVQAYGFRLCITQQDYLKIPWPKPVGYDTNLFMRRIRAAPLSDPTWRPFVVTRTMDGKTDMNADFGIPYQWEWPNATPARRAEILATIYAEQAGWLWWLANDPSVNATTQAWVNSWGPCRDEFVDSGYQTLGWPYENYVRTGRRMVGQKVMTQADMQTALTKTDSIAMGYYSIDFHVAQYLATVVDGVAGYMADGIDYISDSSLRQVSPYQIPFSCMLPVASECTNLLVPVAMSASAVANASMRIDLHKANMGSAAGLAAAKAVKTATALNDLVIADLQADLVALGQVIAPA